MALEIDKERFKKLFPNLAKEMEEGGVTIRGVRSDAEVGEKAFSEIGWSGYMPDVIDFIRRCDTDDQAREIIDYRERRGEITHEYAEKLRRQLNEKGVRSFGPKKEDGYYFKYGGYG